MATETLTIDCSTCELDGTDACADCVVTYICEAERPTATAVALGADEARTLRLLGDAGLVPRVRHVRRAG